MSRTTNQRREVFIMTKLIFSVILTLVFSLPKSSLAVTWVDNHGDDFSGGGKYDYFGSVDVVNDPTSPDSTQNVWRFTFPQGTPTGEGIAAVFFGLPDNTKEWWIQYYFKYSPGFKFHSIGVKQVYGYTYGSDTSNFMISTMNTDGKQLLNLLTQGSNAENHLPNLNPDAWYSTQTGVWHKIKAYMKFNNGGNRDGQWKLWIDDKLISDYHDVMFDSRYSGWRAFGVYPIWGGMAEAVPQTQYLFVDGVYAGSMDPGGGSGKIPSPPGSLLIK